jgi:hypothetical protein
MPEDGLSNGHYPEVGFGEIAIDLPQARFWTTSGSGELAPINECDGDSSETGEW